MFDDTEMRQTLQECLRRVPDLRRYGQKFQKATANLRDLVALYDFVRQLPNILDAFEGHDGGPCPPFPLFESRGVAPPSLLISKGNALPSFFVS